MDKEYTAFAFETLSVQSGNLATSLSSTVYNKAGLPARAATIVVTTGPIISYVYGGVTVGSATGHKATPYTTIELYGNQMIRDFRTTSVSSGTAAGVTVTYFK